MMKKTFYNAYYISFLLFSVILIISSCSTSEPVDESKKFGIYLLQDQSVTWESLQGKNLDSLKLKEWIKSDMINYYDYSTHVICLNVDYKTLLNFPHNDNTPFVVVAGNKICYSGSFGPPKDTTNPYVIFTPLGACNDLVMLEFNPPQREDIRINDNVKSALSSLGKLRTGSSCTISYFSYYHYLDATEDTNWIHINVHGENNENNYIYTVNWGWDLIKVKDKIYRQKMVIYNNDSYFNEAAIKPPYYNNIDIDTINGEDSSYWLDFYDTGCNIKSDGTVMYFNFPKKMQSGTYNCFVEFYGMMGGVKAGRTIPWNRADRVMLGYQRTKTTKIEYDASTKKLKWIW